MKKIIALLLTLVMILGLCACSVTSNTDKVEITLWTYPIGNWATRLPLTL